MTVKVEVGLVGVLGKLAHKESVTLEFNETVAVKDVLQRLSDCSSPAFKQALIDPELNDPRPNVVILVNRREIGVLEGLETKVGDGDKLVLIPVSHGG
ncbi:MAG: MoaD/ThiS family protein [Candidatus Bathyarchaeia archaeon]